MTESKIKNALLKANEICQKSGSRLTEKRQNILLLLLKSNIPLSAYEIADGFNTSYQQSIPPMSVYRILDFLILENLVHKLSSENKFLACSHIACKHEHQIPQFLICKQCRQVKEIGINKEIIEALEASVKNADYKLTNSQLELECLCKKCST